MKTNDAINKSDMVLLITMILLFASSAFAAYPLSCDETAVSCSRADVQTAVDSAIAGTGDKTVCIPAGACDWNSGQPQVQVTCDDDTTTLNIVGFGKASTLLTRTNNDYFIEYDGCLDARVSSMALLGGSSASPRGVQFRTTKQFRVDHINFTGAYRYFAPIDFKSATKGLIDHNTFVNPNVGNGGSYYGITAGSPYSGAKPSAAEECNVVCDCWAGNNEMLPTSSSVALGNTVISSIPAVINNDGGAGAGTVRRIYLRVDSVGASPTVNVASFTRSGNIFTARARTTGLVVAAGHNLFSVDNGDFAAFAINDGDYIGVYLNDAALETNSGSVSWSFAGDYTNSSSNFGTPNIGNDPGIAVEIFDNEGEYSACEATWDAWYDNDAGGRTPSYNGWNENFNPNTDAAIYIEDNTFNWYKSTIMGNWGNSHAYVIRYNTFTTATGETSTGTKDGTVFAMIHDNTYTKTGTTGGYAMRIRSNGLVYNNTITNFSNMIVSNAQRSYSDYYYPYQTRTGHGGAGLFIYNNTLTNMNCGSTEEDCFGGLNGGGDYALTGIGENGTIHLRAPITGESLFGFTEYVYPHPWSSGTPADEMAPSFPPGADVVKNP